MAVLLYDFLQQESHPQPMIIGGGVLPVKGKIVLGGAPKANKSFVALNLAIALAKGQNVFGSPHLAVKQKYKVLYLEQEIGEDGLRERLNGILGGELDPSIEIFIKSRDMAMRLDTPEGREMIDKEIAEVKPDLTIFDPLAKFHLLDENSAQHMGAIMKAGDRYIERHGTSLLYIHHTGKDPTDPDSARRGGNRLRGSSAVFADVDSLILVDRLGANNAKEPTLKMEFTLRRGEPMDDVYVKRHRSGVCTYLPHFLRRGTPAVEPATPAPPVIQSTDHPEFLPKDFAGL